MWTPHTRFRFLITGNGGDTHTGHNDNAVKEGASSGNLIISFCKVGGRLNTCAGSHKFVVYDFEATTAMGIPL